jgi:hypothetical protein
MTGLEYEQFVRAVLCQRLGLEPSSLQSLRSSGVTLPGGAGLKHQIDLFHVEETEIAKYITIIECKYRGSGLVDQQELQNLAFVKENVRAHKAIMVTNKGFTSGAMAVAESQEIALLIIEPETAFVPNPAHDGVDEVFATARDFLRQRSTSAYKIVVTRKLTSDPNSSAFEGLEELLSDPDVNRQAQALLEDPSVKEHARRLAAENPDLLKSAMDFLGKRRW